MPAGMQICTAHEQEHQCSCFALLTAHCFLQDLFPSPPATPTGEVQQNGEAGRGDGGAASPSAPKPHTPTMAGSDYKPPPLRRVEDAYAAAPDSVVANASTSAATSGGRHILPSRAAKCNGCGIVQGLQNLSRIHPCN